MEIQNKSKQKTLGLRLGLLSLFMMNNYDMQHSSTLIDLEVKALEVQKFSSIQGYKHDTRYVPFVSD